MNGNARHDGRAPIVRSDNDLDSPASSTRRAPQAKHSIARQAVTLPEPVRVAEFWKNRRGESIRATLATYEGRNYFDLRQHCTAHDGKMQPTQKGINVAVLRLPELARAVAKALATARELGLIDGEEAAS
jgi:hypothetical protein